jgi:hypothetical protein
MWLPSITTIKYVAGLCKLANDVMIVQKDPQNKTLAKTSIKHNPTNKQTKKTPKITRLLQQHKQELLLLQHTNATNIFLPTLFIPKCGSRVVILVCGK